MSTPGLPADGDESPFRWSSFTLRRTIVFSLALHALIGGLLVLTAADKPAADEAPGTTVVSLRHEIAASPAPAARTASGGTHAAAGSAATAPATTAVVATTAPTAMRVTPVRAIDTAATATGAAIAMPATTPDVAPAATSPGASPTAVAAAANTGNPVDTTAIDDARRRYLGALGPLLRKHLVYPPAAQRRGLEGQVMLSLRIARDGSVHALAVQRSSGEPLLDDGALATVRRAAPLPPLPAGLPEAALDVNVPLSFGLDTRSAPND